MMQWLSSRPKASNLAELDVSKLQVTPRELHVEWSKATFYTYASRDSGKTKIIAKTDEL
jgi:hypothetical protein